MSHATRSAPKAKPENLLLNLVCNVALPTVILSWGSGEKALGPKWGLIVALAFPVGYGIYDFAVRRRCNFISVIGFASVLASGGFGLLKLEGFWFAVKDAAIPSIIGIAVLASMRAKEPLVHELLYNPQVIDVARVEAALAERGAQPAFAKLLYSSSYLLALAMFVSAALNFFLARYLLRSPPGTPEFNAELGKMHWMSWPVIVLPSMAMMMYAMWRLFKGVERLTGLELDQIMHQPPEKKATVTDRDASRGSAAAKAMADKDGTPPTAE